MATEVELFEFQDIASRPSIRGYVDSDGKAQIALGGINISATNVTLSGAYQVTALDDGKVFTCTAALTITIPAALSPRPSFIVNPPSSGNVSIAVSGGAQVNGATTTLTRARTANVAGFAVVPYAESDGYGVSGA